MRRRKIDTAFLAALEDGFAARLAPVYADLRDEVLAYSARRNEVPETQRDRAAIVLDYCEDKARHIASLHEAAAGFNTRYAHALDEAERRASIMTFAEALGADRARLRRDAKALDKFFDADAVTERYRKRLGESERALAYGLDRLGLLVANALEAGEIESDTPLLADRTAGFLQKMRSWRGDSRVRQGAHRCLLRISRGRAEPLDGFWVDLAVRDTRRVALDAAEDTWAQCDALSSLLSLSPKSFDTVLASRLDAAADRGSVLRQDNRMFIRRHIARLVAGAVGDNPDLARHLLHLANDRDGAVRQAVAESLPLLPPDLFASHATRARTDRDPQVRAMLFAEPEAMAGAGGSTAYMHHLLRVLGREDDEFVLRISIDAAARFATWLTQQDEPGLEDELYTLREALAALRERVSSPKVRRWAGEASERIWLVGDAQARALADEISRTIAGQREGRSRKLGSLAEPLAEDADRVGRVLSVLTQSDFALELSGRRRVRITRGDMLARRLWRALFEFRNSATDKRQAFFHTIGRHYPGWISAPSARMAELAPTKVPGEPLFVGNEGGWRNYVPLLDQVLSALDRGVDMRVYTSEGVTLIEVPRGVVRRLRAFWRISRNFAAIASLRNREPEDYVAALRENGIGLSFTPHLLPARAGASAFENSDQGADPEVTGLFSAGAALLAFQGFWQEAALREFASDAADYFTTVYQNSLGDLAVFLVGGCLFFFGRHIWLGRQARRLRKEMPLSLGGWGTRGKSGTERLKAGLINALGAPLVSKTTGCEAMFLLGNAFGDLTEMFLFRPYDKATIWEQYNLLRTSNGLGTRVFLWECMGLNPAYVRVLQQDWMRDDIGTITNTYPDHEDVQGPAGRNIPEVMCEFIPHNSVLLTTEEEMLPILREGAEKADTRLRAINWKQAGLVHQNLLDRFPYAEHPYNIALVTAMGDELGLEHDFCVKEMSDRVVADLGVLKVYPRSEIAGRTLEFVMGMSANERFGAMGNWTRMGFAEHDIERDPEIYVTTVVNNRADRVPRSRVFARMLVNDVSADKHFLIGSNIEGLVGFIEEEWDAYAADLTLFDDEAPSPTEVLADLARKQRVPLSHAALEGRLAAMLEPHADKITRHAALKAASEGRLATALAEAKIPHAEAIAAHYESEAALHREFSELLSVVERGGDHAALDRQARDFLHRAFRRKIVPIRDYYMPGEQIVRLVARETPPGLVNRIMGMQNIKGTGLDWVYRWQAWDAVAKACTQLLDSDHAAADRGFQLLFAFQEYGALSEKLVRETIATLRERPELPAAITPAQLDAILSRLDAQLADQAGAGDDTGEVAGDDAGGGILSRFFANLTSGMEAFLDASDAVSRRRAADRIYKAMIAEQIGSQRAALELKKLTSRQKGGWFAASLADTGTKLRALIPSRSPSRRH